MTYTTTTLIDMTGLTRMGVLKRIRKHCGMENRPYHLVRTRQGNSVREFTFTEEEVRKCGFLGNQEERKGRRARRSPDKVRMPPPPAKEDTELYDYEVKFLRLIKERPRTMHEVNALGAGISLNAVQVMLLKLETLGFLIYESGTNRNVRYGLLGVAEGSRAEKMKF